MTRINPGIICVLGGGAAIPASGKSHEYLAQQLPDKPRISVLETPAGFELNCDAVAEKLAAFMRKRLQNYSPQIATLPARKRGTACSPDEHGIVAPILQADEIVLGPGSPTYCARQLSGSLATDYIKARQWQGGTLMLSSSSTLAFGRFTMPVYEIYKVGEDLHWKDGVDYFADYGLQLSLVPHWDNRDGGDELDTSRCYVGKPRWNKLYPLLPPDQTILGLDDHTSAMLDFRTGEATVVGANSVTVLRNGENKVFQSGEVFSLDELGEWQLPEEGMLSADIWQAADAAWQQRLAASSAPTPSDEVLALVEARLLARQNKQWQQSDSLRDQIAALGWRVKDARNSYELEPI